MAPARRTRDLSASGAQALKQAITNACRAIMPLDADDEIVDPHEDLWPTLLGYLAQSVTQYLERQNYARSPIARLSAEVLHIIFEHVQLPDRVTISRICRTWREISKMCPIIVPSKLAKQPTKLLCLLRATSPAPLCFDELDIRPENSKTLARCIREHMPRIRVLDIVIMYWNPHRSLWSALKQPAPQLRRLRICDSDGFLYLRPAAEFLSSHAPQLTNCFFSGSGGLQGSFNLCSHFSSIRTLVFINRVGWPEIVTGFTAFPQLEYLSIDAASWDTGDPGDEGPPSDVPPDVRARITTPAHLRYLCIMSDYPQVPACVLSTIAHNRVLIIAISYRGGYYEDGSSERRSATNLVSHLVPGAITSVHISFSKSDNYRTVRWRYSVNFSIQIKTSAGHIRVHKDLQLDALQDVLSQLRDTVSSMTFSDLHLLRVDDPGFRWTAPDLQLPTSIQTLTIVVYADTLEPEDDSDDDSISSRWLLTPALGVSDPDCIAFALPHEEVSADSAPPTVSAERLSAFLRDTVRRRTARRLRTVRLQGIDVDDASALGEFADEIMVEPPLRDHVLSEDEVLAFDSWPYP